MPRATTSLSQPLMSALLFVLLLGCAWEFGWSQDTQPASKSADSSAGEGTSPKKDSAKSSGKPSADGPSSTVKIRMLPNKNGELVEVPDGATVEEYFDWVRNRNNPAGPSPATINDVEIVGVADDDRANLTVKFTVALSQPDQFVSVPLGFKEASLRNWKYQGDGEESPNTERKDPDQGFVWWFKGRGPHVLELSLSAPFLKELPSRRLLVSLPQSPICGMRMTLPYSSVIAKIRPEQTVVEIKPVGEGKTLVEAIGLGSKLDLTWQPNVDVRPNEVSLESQTTIRAQIEADRVLLRAEQQVKSLQGLFDRVVVRIPTGAELIKLDDPEKLSYKLDPENRQRVLVSLKEKANSAQLSWTLLLPIKMPTPIPLTIDGFFVEGARKQVGKIGLSVAEGLRSSGPHDPSLLGINAGEFPTTMGSVSRAYQFLSQPFKLAVVVDEVKPYFQVKPILRLIASAQQLTLDGEFEFRVDRDSLNEIVLTWPNLKSEGWTIEPLDEPGIVERYSVDDKGQITARLIKHRTGTFSVHLRARRPLKPGDEIGFTLPRPKSASRLSATNLILVNAENVDSDLTARGETAFHLLPSSSLDLKSLPESMRSLKVAPYRVDTDEQFFGLRVIPQKQRIRTESFTEAKWQDNQFRLVQRLSYDVSYERLSQVRLTVPESINVERVQFFMNRDELTPESPPPLAGGPRLVQLNLGEAQLGHFEIQARFSLSFPKESAFDTDSVANLPILGSFDEPFSQTSVSLAQSDWFDAEPVSGETWRPQLNRQEAWQWMATGAQAVLPLKLVRSTHAYETGNISRALLSVNLNGKGVAAIRAQFRVITRATSLPVVFPQNVTPPTFFWDDRQLTENECPESPVGSRRYTIQLAEPADGASPTAHLLTVDYHGLLGSSMSWSDRLELRSPQLPTCSWSQVYWQTILPVDQHMLTYPSSATPMFHWQRSGLFWSRISDPGSSQLQQWITSGTTKRPPEPDDLISEKSGNFYSFSQFDSPKPLVFHTLSSPMVLLFGAGFSLVFGFLMFRLVVLRHVLTLLLLGLIAAIAGLWYSAPLELLFQPMVAGLAFPAVAVILEGWLRRKFHRATIGFDGDGEFPSMQAFGSHYMVRQSDPNEATTHRPAIRDSESSVRIESGSGVS